MDKKFEVVDIKADEKEEEQHIYNILWSTDSRPIIGGGKVFDLVKYL
jgi:hypothetical protein